MERHNFHYDEDSGDDFFISNLDSPSIEGIPSNRVRIARYEFSRKEKPFLQRQNKWKSKRERSLRARKSDVEKNIMNECTFKPAVGSAISKDKILKSYHRTYNKARQKMMRHQEKKELELLKNCTFIPNRSKRKVVGSGRNSQYNTPKYSKRKVNRTSNVLISNFEKPRKSISQPIEKSEVKFVERLAKPKKVKRVKDPKCTFKPSINKQYFEKKKGRNNFGYFGNNAFERLSKQRKKAYRSTRRSDSPGLGSRRMSDIQIRSLSLANTPKSSTSKLSRRPKSAIGTRNREKNIFQKPDNMLFSNDELLSSFERKKHIKSSKKAIREFLKRTEERDQLKNQRLKILKDGYEPKYKPDINPKSKSIMKSGPSFLDRLEVKLAMKKAKVQDLHSSSKEEYLFRPSINEKSKRMSKRKKTVSERYKQYLETEEKLAAMREELEKKRMKEFTFKPRINKNFKQKDLKSRKYENLYRKGTTGFNNPAIYMRRIQEQEKRKKWNERRRQVEEKRKELEDCTFKPQIKNLPGYVKKISKTYSLSKMDYMTSEKKKESWK